VDNKDIELLDDLPPSATVPIKGRDGQVKHYTVTEASGGTEEFWDWMTRFMTLQAEMAADENPRKAIDLGFRLTKLQAELIAMCVTLDGQPVPEAEALKWRPSTRRGVFQKCQELNGMVSAANDSEGKGLSGGDASGGGTKSPDDTSTAPSPTSNGKSVAASTSAGV
jgi:hypothetical protein